jgi:hypothetical protein
VSVGCDKVEGTYPDAASESRNLKIPSYNPLHTVEHNPSLIPEHRALKGRGDMDSDYNFDEPKVLQAESTFLKNYSNS